MPFLTFYRKKLSHWLLFEKNWRVEKTFKEFEKRFESESACHSKRMTIGNVSDKKNSYKILFSEMIDEVKVKTTQRFSSVNQLDCIILLDFRCFNEFSKIFPVERSANLSRFYGQCFDFLPLRSQQSVVYSREQFHRNSVSEMLIFCWYYWCYTAGLEGRMSYHYNSGKSTSVERSFLALNGYILVD